MPDEIKPQETVVPPIEEVVEADELKETIQYVSLLSEASDVEILKLGIIQDRGIEITQQMLDDYIENFRSNAYGTELQINYAHQREGEAAGWIKDLYQQGDTLMAKVEWTPVGAEKVKNKQFRYTSSELQSKHKHHETGKLVNNVLIGVGLTNIPAVKGMKALTLSEKEQLEIIILKESMDKVKKMYAELMKKTSCSASDVASFKEACADCMGEDGVEEMLAKVTGRSDNSEVADKSNTMSLTEQLKEQGLVALTEAKLAELTAHAEAGMKANKALEALQLAEEVKTEYMLSENRSVGFKKTEVQAVASFIQTLNEEQRTAFKGLFNKIVSVNLNEEGVTVEPDDVSGHTEEEKILEANKIAEEIVEKEGVELSEAITRAYEQVGLTSK